MKTTTFHPTNFGTFAPNCSTDSEGFVHVHDSPRYAKASEEKLQEYLSSRLFLVRNAAKTEVASRKLAKWQQR